jgi:tRNA A-37 threonylcarbamoyl transferase component Bud32
MSGAPASIELEALRARRSPPAPFTLALPGREPLVAERVYRHLPGRRLVFRARAGGEALLIKLFFDRRDYRRECAGLELLHAHGVPSPALRWHHRCRGAWLLATEFLSAAHSLAERLDAAEAPAEAGAVLTLLDRLHRAGLIQRDAHLDNFLIRDGIAHAIDGAGIRRTRSTRALRANLALLLAQFPPAWDARLQELLRACGGREGDAALARAWRRARRRRLRRYRRKCVRSCTEFVAERSWRHFAARRRDRGDAGFLELLAAPERAVAAAPRLKDGNTATVVRVPGAARDLVVKRYNVKDWRHGLRRALRRSRAWTSWQSANLLHHIGVPTPRAVGLREVRWGPFRRVTYLITEASEGTPLQEWLPARGAAAVPAWLDRALLATFAALAAAGLSHGDLKASNFLVEEADQRLLLIDLDAVCLHRSERTARRALARDRERFLANWDGALHRHFDQLLAPLALAGRHRRQEL